MLMLRQLHVLGMLSQQAYEVLNQMRRERGGGLRRKSLPARAVGHVQHFQYLGSLGGRQQLFMQFVERGFVKVTLYIGSQQVLVDFHGL